MKRYSCKICKNLGKQFSGMRSEVRKHLKEKHNIRGKRKDADGKNMPSQITYNILIDNTC